MIDSEATAIKGEPPGGGRRDRSPNFPMIDLGRAVERAQQLYNRARRYEVRLPDAATAWNIKPTSSALGRVAAAVIAFGLAEDSGTGDARKIKISDLGWRILEDQRPGARGKGLAEAALKPKLIADYAEHWKTGRPDDEFCISELKIDRGFNEEAAAQFLRVFDETIRFAGINTTDIIADSVAGGGRGDGQGAVNPLAPPRNMKMGDYVQWTSNGAEQFKVPRLVVALFPDGKHAQVFGSVSGIPMNELIVVEPPEAAVTLAAAEVQIERNSAGRLGENDYVVLQRGNRLQITADVDLEGIATLKEMLADYESILKRLAGKKE